MKKIFLQALVCILSVNAFALNAEVLSTIGKVEVMQGDSWVKLNEGDTIETGALVSTGFKSEAKLKVAGSEFILGPLTRITVEELVSSSKKDNTQLFLDSGSVDATVNSEDGKRVGFKVRSPVATASVRGTQFRIKANGKVSTKKGLVHKGRAESKRAEILSVPAENSESENESIKDENKNKRGVFSSVNQKGDTFGTPVYAGWSSRTDWITGRSTSPYSEKILESTKNPSTHGNIATEERKSSGSITSGNSGENTENSEDKGKASLTVNIVF